MSEHDPESEETIFSTALQRGPAERAPYLDEACAGQPALRQRIEQLLKAQPQLGEFMENPADLGTAGAPETIGLTVPPEEKPGTRIGRYKLLQKIGEGGCGVVYMAEQEEPVRRRVALKVIKLGMDTKSVIARFEAERQALAMMDHPNIAKVLDGGSTESGRPYFVMELVRGIKITEFCDQNRLPTRERLDLFIQVCQAVQHAHQKGIIHRDLKPSNILVTLHDPGAPGVPMIIDFGIAKATQGRLTDQTLYTAFEQFLGTPAYMSPEQAMMTALDIDTRSDIYSLGVLLYELLTGHAPFDAKELLAAGFEEMRRTIREKEPLRPSTRLSTLLAAEQTTAASLRQTEPPKLVHLVRGDLDWIVMKCLEKDRARRYETANGLAMDLQRHLTNEPVVARPPSRFYVFQKTVRRHKVGFAAAAALVLVLAAGVIVSTSEAIRATRAERTQSVLRAQADTNRKKSETEATKATAVSEFLQEMLRSADPNNLKRSDYTVRQMLDDFSARLNKQLAGQADLEAALHRTIGAAYRGLGLREKAEGHLQRALALRRQLYGEQGEEVAQSLIDHAWNLSDGGRLPEAEAEARRALDIYRQRGADAQAVLQASWVLGVILNNEDRFQEMETISEEALARARSSPKHDLPEVANILHNLADAKTGQRKYVEAEKVALEALELHRRLQGPEHPETAWAFIMLGRALAGQNRLAEAERNHRNALVIFRRYYAPEHQYVHIAEAELKAVLQTMSDPRALDLIPREDLARQKSLLERRGLEVASAFGNLANALQREGSYAEAEKALRDGLNRIQLQSQASETLPSLLRLLTEVLTEMVQAPGTSVDAEPLFDDLLALERKFLDPFDPLLGETLHQHGEYLLHQRNDSRKAAEQYKASLPIRRLKTDEGLAWTLRALYFALRDLNEPAQCEMYIRESLDVSRKLYGNYANETRLATTCLANTLQDEGKGAEAESLLQDVTNHVQPGTGSDDLLTDAQSTLLEIQMQRALAAGEYDAAERAARQSVAVFEKLVDSNPNRSDNRIGLGHSQWRLAKVLVEAGRRHQTEAVARAFVQTFEKATHDFPREPFLRQELAYSHRFLGNVIEGDRQTEEAERHHRAAIELYAGLKAEAPLNSFYYEEEANTYVLLAEKLKHAGRPEAAVAEYRKAIALHEELLAKFAAPEPEIRPRLASIRLGLASLLRNQGKVAEAESVERQAAEWKQKVSEFEQAPK